MNDLPCPLLYLTLSLAIPYPVPCYTLPCPLLYLTLSLAIPYPVPCYTLPCPLLLYMANAKNGYGKEIIVSEQCLDKISSGC